MQVPARARVIIIVLGIIALCFLVRLETTTEEKILSQETFYALLAMILIGTLSPAIIEVILSKYFSGKGD